MQLFEPLQHVGLHLSNLLRSLLKTDPNLVSQIHNYV